MTLVCRRSCASSRATTLTTPRQEASSLGSFRAIAVLEKRQQPPWSCLSLATRSIHSHWDTHAYNETHSDNTHSKNTHTRIPAPFNTWHCCTRSIIPHGPRSRPHELSTKLSLSAGLAQDASRDGLCRCRQQPWPHQHPSRYHVPAVGVCAWRPPLNVWLLNHFRFHMAAHCMFACIMYWYLLSLAIMIVALSAPGIKMTCLFNTVAPTYHMR